VESIDEVDCATAAAVRLARYLNEQAGNGIADRRPDTQKPGACEPDDKTDDKHDAKTDTKTDTMGRRDTTRCAVAVSGTVDLVTDGETVYRLPGGSAMMTKITGAGCSLGGVLATYLAVADPLVAALSASLLYNRAGEQAEQGAQGPGSFQVAFLDALWNVTAEQVSGSPLLVG
jgi:hydroxyethylthiazole kinase